MSLKNMVTELETAAKICFDSILSQSENNFTNVIECMCVSAQQCTNNRCKSFVIFPPKIGLPLFESSIYSFLEQWTVNGENECIWQCKHLAYSDCEECAIVSVYVIASKTIHWRRFVVVVALFFPLCTTKYSKWTSNGNYSKNVRHFSSIALHFVFIWNRFESNRL